MRWSIIRIIWLRELRDQFRDRRTILMILVLPLVIYPLAGFGLTQLALGMAEESHVVGVVGLDHLKPGLVSPFEEKDGALTLREAFHQSGSDKHTLRLARIASEGEARRLLGQRKLDVVLIIPEGFDPTLPGGDPPQLRLLSRPGDDGSRRATLRVTLLLNAWNELLKRIRFNRQGLPPHFDQPFRTDNPLMKGAVEGQGGEELMALLLRMFPFVIVMWSLAGALYPAVDLCAGEKERGTMETLLISPAGREEIVLGKFFAIWVFSGATALLNLLSMAVTVSQFSGMYKAGSLNWAGVGWCVVLLVPLSAFFSAVCLAVGAYARSSKEGQYYLMPLFLIAMPLLFLTLAPGVELSPLYSMIPITGVALLLQQLLIVDASGEGPWLYFIPVLLPLVLYGWVALRWAIVQFNREDVLFREAERLEVGLWLRRLLREKEVRPSAGQAIFCFGLIFLFSWLTLGMIQRGLLITNAIRYVAFVATPTLVMAIMITKQPLQSLSLRVPPRWAWPVAVLLALLLLPPLTTVTLAILKQFPVVQELIKENRPLTGWLEQLGTSAEGGGTWLLALLVFAWLPAVCEELAFRGFILTGLQRRFRPRTAVMISSLLFALVHMNVFQFIPTFLLGMVLGYLTTRCGSVLPSMLFHLVYNSLVLGPALLPGLTSAAGEAVPLFEWDWFLWGSAVVCTPLALGILWWLTKLQPHPEYVRFLSSDPSLRVKEAENG